MPYFHQTICISPQAGFPLKFSNVSESKNNLLEVIEPAYPGIPASAKRRMGKSVRMAVGSAVMLLEKYPQPSGIVIATANGGMEDCIKFLNQILEYKEGLLTPASFVQSTSNAGAAQIALVTRNHHYNITHVHRGLAFEDAMLDVLMCLKENEHGGYLLGCTDEISAYNYNIDRLAGWYRADVVSSAQLYQQQADGSIAGEGAFMCWMDNVRAGATAELKAIRTMHTRDKTLVADALREFLSESTDTPDLLITGENGDQRLLPFYESVESLIDETVTVARFKHLSGEFCTATSYACWLAITCLQSGQVPETMIKKNAGVKPVRNILIYNNYRGEQHAFMLLSGVDHR